MKILFSIEADISVGPIINNIVKIIEKKIRSIDLSDYTTVIDRLTIVPTCYNDWQLEFGLGKPRKYISYSKKYADIRLGISYDEFLSADKKKRYEMVKRNIYESIDVLNERINKKKDGSFDGVKLLSDIEEKLEEIEL